MSPLNIPGPTCFHVIYGTWTSERNIPSIVSTIQLLLLSILCLATGISSVKISWAERLYWLVLCMGITVIALIEYGMITHTFVPTL